MKCINQTKETIKNDDEINESKQDNDDKDDE